MCEISLIDSRTMNGELVERRMTCVMLQMKMRELVQMTCSDTLCLHTFSQCTISQAPFLNTVVGSERDEGSESKRGRDKEEKEMRKNQKQMTN